MQRVLPWTLLIVGLLVGYVVGLGSRPVPGVPPSPPSSTAPEDLLPFHLASCNTALSDCRGRVSFPVGIKPTPTPSPTPKPGGPPTTPRPPTTFSILSNMSVNGGGREEHAAWNPALTDHGPQIVISIPEDPNDKYVPQRLQTLYVEVIAGKPVYTLATCYADKVQNPTNAATAYCSEDGKQTLHHDN